MYICKAATNLIELIVVHSFIVMILMHLISQSKYLEIGLLELPIRRAWRIF